jgi:hypothetical protein
MTDASHSPWVRRPATTKPPAEDLLLFPERIRVQTSATGIAGGERGKLHARTGLDDCDLRDGIMCADLGASAEAAADASALRVRA